jgi:hypothetical protein
MKAQKNLVQAWNGEGALAVGHHRRRDAGRVVPDHDVGTGHAAAACIDDDARIVDVVLAWPNAALAEIRSIEVTRTANKPLMPTLSPKNTVVQMRNTCNRRTGVAVKQQVFRAEANRRVDAQSPQALTVEHVGVDPLPPPLSVRAAVREQLH